MTHSGSTTAWWDFPSTLSVSDRPFVGRQPEVEVVHDAWKRALQGGLEVVLVAGEAGAGKSRLLTEVAQEFHAAGAIVLSGLNDSELSLPYQPWIMVVDQLLRGLPDDIVADHVDALGILQLLDPRIERRTAAAGHPELLDPEERRHHLLRALAALLADAADIAPTVLILDDLHWAGQQTLDVLRYLASTAPVPRLLVLGAFRDSGEGGSDPLTATLADLRRFERVTRVRLAGLDRQAVLDLVAAWRVGAASSAADVGVAIAERTGGNPFLIWELCLHLDRAEGPVPESVVEVVAARTQRLSIGSRRAAELIAIAGNRVELSVLEQSTGFGDELGGVIAELVGSGLIVELTAPVPEYQFAHALLREAVAALVPAPRQMQHHLALAQAIEQVHETDRRSMLPHLARHYAASATVGGRDKAIYYGRRAALQARQTAAYDEGVAVLRTVLDAAPPGGADVVDLTIDLIDLLQRSGHHVESMAVGGSAFGIARAMGDVRRQAEVALQCQRANHLAGGGGPEITEMLETVLAEVGGEDDPTRVRLRSALGRARCLAGDDTGDDLMEAALHEARELGDADALALALEVSLLGSQPAEILLARTHELEALTTASGDPWATMWATANRIRLLLVLGRLEEAAVELQSHRDIAHRNRFFLFQFMSCVLQSVLHLTDGHFDLAEAAAAEAEAIGLNDEGQPASGIHGLLMFSIRREQGRLDEMRPILSLISRTGHRAGVWSPGVALAAAELGLEEEARAAFEAVAAEGFAQIPRDHVWPATLTFLCETALILEDVERAPVLLDELAPFGGQTLMAGFTTSFGPTDRLRSALNELIDRRSDADRFIASARNLAVSSGSIVWQARVEQTHAWIHARRDELASAAEHHEAARRLAEPIGMRSVLDLRPTPDTGPSPETPHPEPAGLSPREVDVLLLIAEGCSNREIAERLLISPNTAANHVRSILQKTGSANRAQAAAYSVRISQER